MSEERVIDCELSLLSGIIPISDQSNRESVYRNIEYLSLRVKTELFSRVGQVLVGLALLCRQSDAVLTEDILVDWLQRKQVEPEQMVELQMRFDQARRQEISEGKFRYVVSIFLQEKELELFKLKLNDAYKIVETGMKVGRAELKGLGAAREYLITSMFKLDQVFLEDTPHGNVLKDGKEVWSEYLERRDRPESFEGVKTGLKAVDDLTNGALPGELWLIAAFSGHGKTNTLINWIYNAAIVQRKNVVVAVNEMLYRQYRIRLFIRHTRNERFNLANGVPYSHYKEGRIDPVQEQAFQRVIEDFETNPDYGRIEVFQIPKNAGMDFVASRVTALQSMFNVDALYIDYLQLVGSDAKKQRDRDYLNSLLVDTKQLAVSFNRGKGIPIISPWQINRASFKQALETKSYNLDCLSESAEAERSSDFVMWLLRTKAELDNHELLAGVVKYRDGIISETFKIYEDFRTYYIGNMDRYDVAPDPVSLLDINGESLI